MRATKSRKNKTDSKVSPGKSKRFRRLKPFAGITDENLKDMILCLNVAYGTQDPSIYDGDDLLGSLAIRAEKYNRKVLVLQDICRKELGRRAEKQSRDYDSVNIRDIKMPGPGY